MPTAAVCYTFIHSVLIMRCKILALPRYTGGVNISVHDRLNDNNNYYTSIRVLVI